MISVAMRRLEHQGMCDASAAISLDDNHFLVASDEDSYLRVYRAHSSGMPVSEPVDFSDWLGLDSGDSESEIEAAANLRGVTYWISSHGRNSNGKLKLDRQHFFGTKILWKNGFLEVTLVGRSYHSLLFDLLSRSSLSDYTEERMQDMRIADLAPKKKGAVNIEGLCAYNDSLLIGFRNPVPDGKALLIPFDNPHEVVKDNDRPQFGDPLLWDLGGLGIRSIEYLPDRDVYALVAGSYDGHRMFELFEWSGRRNETPQHVRALIGLNPESIIGFANRDSALLLSDNGADRDSEAGCECKELPSDHPRKRFESAWLSW